MKNEVKSLFLDIYLLYKNIIHWNISKTIIFFYSILLWFLFTIPFLILFFVYSFFSVNQFSDILNSFFNWVYMHWLMWNAIYILVLFSFVLWYFYSFILKINLNINYILWNKLDYKKNYYFNFSILIKYLFISLISIWLFLIPIFLFILLLSIFIFIFWWIDSVISLLVANTNSVFPLISLVLFISLLFTLFYLFYRFIFSYFILLESENNNKKSYNILLESFNKTKWFKKFLHFLVSILIIFSIYIPFSVVNNYLDRNYQDLNNYAAYYNLKEEDKESLKQISSYKYSNLEIRYGWMKQEDIEKMQYKFYYLSIIFSIFKFLIISWLFAMFLTSFYVRNIKSVK